MTRFLAQFPIPSTLLNKRRVLQLCLGIVVALFTLPLNAQPKPTDDSESADESARSGSKAPKEAAGEKKTVKGTDSDKTKKPDGEVSEEAKASGDEKTSDEAETSETGEASGEAQASADSIQPKAQKCVAIERKKGGTDAALTAADEAKRRADDAEASAELAALNKEVGSFGIQVEEYRADVKRIVELQYERRRRRIKARYSKLIQDLTKEERTRRVAAIERFEKFLAKYPNNVRYTPDALFRLAELYFEQANDIYIAAQEKFDELSLAFDEGKVEEEPRPPEQDYSRTIALFERLINSWPKYRNMDGAYYLRGYCQAEMGEYVKSRQSFLALVKRFPKSRFAPETWTRIGEYFFDDNKLAQAINAYSKVLQFKTSGYYDKALYKLAWTYYRNDQYVEAIDRFRRLIEFSDLKAKQTGRAGSDLRKEAVQYLAISLQEDDWDGDGEPDANSGFPRVMQFVTGDRSYDVEVLRELAEIFFNNAKFPEAIATIRFLLKTFPTHEGNPELHSRMISAYHRQQRRDDAFSERDRLSSSYGPGTQWYEANRDKPKTLQSAEELMEDALKMATQYHHTEAQKARRRAEQGDLSAESVAVAEYAAAAEAYERYLARFPKSEDAYTLNFFYGECLYYSGKFARAAVQYEKVRDSLLGSKFKESAAFFGILSREKAVREQIVAGQISPKPSLVGKTPGVVAAAPSTEDDDNDGLVREITPEPIPTAVQELVDSRRRYIDECLVSSEDATRLPRNVYNLAEVYFDYKHFKEARAWYAWLIERYPKQKFAGYAAANLIETYRQANDWKKMAEWAEKIAAAGLGREFDDEIRTLKVGALFKTAKRLHEDGKHEQAAREYMRLVDENPGNRFADRALNNAAVAFEDIRRFESATKAYERIYRKYPKSEFVEHALFRVGVNSERFYDYDKAIRTYLKLVAQFPQSKHRADALYKAAKKQEQTQQYREAAKNYERYVALFPDRKDTAETFFEAAKVYRKLGDTKNEIRIYEKFLREYGNYPDQNSRSLKGIARIADIYQSQGKRRKAAVTWQRVIDEFNRRGMQFGTNDAQHPARATFELVENDFARYERLKPKGSLKNQRRIIVDMQRWVKQLRKRYEDVLQYKYPSWNIAALYRRGHIFQLFAESLYDAPVPKNLSAEEEDVYRTTLEDVALPIEDEAVKNYEVAVTKARELKIVNEWTKRIFQSLNKYKPADYPLFKEERRVVIERQMTAPRLIDLSPPKEKPKGEDIPKPEAAGSETDSASAPDDKAVETAEDSSVKESQPEDTPEKSSDEEVGQ